MILLRQPGRLLPSIPVPINRDLPISQGIISCTQHWANGIDVVSKLLPTTVGTTVNRVVGPKGRGDSFNSTGYLTYPNVDQLVYGKGYTVLVMARSTSLAAQSGMVAKWDGGGGNNVPMTFFVRASGELALWRNVGGGNNGTVGTTTTMGGTTGLSVISTGVDFIASVDAGSTVHSLPNIYLNGSLRNRGWTFGPSGSDVALSEPSGSTFGVGPSNGGTTTWQGIIYFQVSWNRRLTPNEHLALHENPLLILDTQGARRIISLGSSGTVYPVAFGVTRASTVAIVRRANKPLATTRATTVTLTRAATVSRALAVTRASVVAIVRRVNKILTVTRATAVALVKRVNKTLTVTRATTAAVVKRANKILAVTRATTVTLTRAATVSRALAVTRASVVLMTRAATVSRALAVTRASTVAIARRVNKILAITRAATLAIVKRVGKTLAITRATATGVAKRLGVAISRTAATSPALQRTRITLRTLAATVAGALSITWSVISAGAVTAGKTIWSLAPRPAKWNIWRDW